MAEKNKNRKSDRHFNLEKYVVRSFVIEKDADILEAVPTKSELNKQKPVVPPIAPVKKPENIKMPSNAPKVEDVKKPENIAVVCRCDDGAELPIYDKPFALKIGDLGITNDDRKFINTLIFRRMFTEDGNSLVDIQDYLQHYPIHAEEGGIEYNFLAENIKEDGQPEFPGANRIGVWVIALDGQAPVFTRVVR